MFCYLDGGIWYRFYIGHQHQCVTDDDLYRIYLNANFAMAAALSLVLGGITWVCLAVARIKGAASVSMGG